MKNVAKTLAHKTAFSLSTEYQLDFIYIKKEVGKHSETDSI